jgi:hypothetical protein
MSTDRFDILNRSLGRTTMTKPPAGVGVGGGGEGKGREGKDWSVGEGIGGYASSTYARARYMAAPRPH